MFNPLGFASLSALEAAVAPLNRCTCTCSCSNPVTVTVSIAVQ